MTTTAERRSPEGSSLPSLFLLPALAFALLGCRSPELAGDNDDPRVGAYEAVIIDLTERQPPTTEDEDQLPVVYIDALAPEGIELEVQVELVARFDDIYEIRFIDDVAEATDAELPPHRVKPGSVLIGLGPVVGDDQVDIRAEWYQSEDDVKAYRYTMAESDPGGWQIDGERVEVEPEGFVSEP